MRVGDPGSARFSTAASLSICVVLFLSTSQRLLHPPDVGSEGKEVVDEAREIREAVGLVIQRDQFPDRLFAPPKRTGLLPDGYNPVYDKEMRSELFSQGTLMLRVVIQVSDGAGRTDTQAIAVNVTPVNDNNPIISSDGGGPSATASHRTA